MNEGNLDYDLNAYHNLELKRLEDKPFKGATSKDFPIIKKDGHLYSQDISKTTEIATKSQDDIISYIKNT